MSTITGLVIMTGILVGGAVAVIAIQEWGKVKMAKAKRSLFNLVKERDDEDG